MRQSTQTTSLSLHQLSQNGFVSCSDDDNSNNKYKVMTRMYFESDSANLFKWESAMPYYIHEFMFCSNNKRTAHSIGNP